MNRINLARIYEKRFHGDASLQAIKSRNSAWLALYGKVLKKYIEPEFTVLDLGSGPGYFINQVDATKKYAVALDQNNSRFIHDDVSFQCTKAQDLNFASDNSIDLVFTSNLFEHLGTREILMESLNELHRVLRNESSKLIVLMPNIRYAKWDFYNFIDHNLPLNEVSLREALEICQFKILEEHKKFFPYTAKGLQVSIPLALVKFYLTLPPRLRPRAKQMFFVAQPINN